jgi:DNA-binding CsgD family transcriptional regulator
MSKLTKLEQTMDLILKCQSIEQVWPLFAESMAHYGFDRMIYASNRFRTVGTFGDPDDALLLTNHDSAYIDAFIGKALFLDAPMFNWSAKNTGVCSWKWAQDRCEQGLNSPAENQVINFNDRMGVVAGYSVSFQDISGRSIAGVGLCAKAGLSQADVDLIWDENGDELFLLNNLAHHKIASLPHKRRGKSLTKRQKEVLQWVADGKTMADIAAIMGLNAATVEKHLRLARDSLNVDTTAQAILKVSVQNQFFLVEDFGMQRVGKPYPFELKR